MEKCFVLDTNVLIHNPQAIYSFGDNKVIIPILVIEELDHFKSISDKKGMHARQVLRELDSLIKKGALNKGARMKNKGTLVIGFGPREIDMPDIDETIVDNRILAVAFDLQKKGEAVFFISKDVNARIKAEALGIKARDYEKEKVEYTSLYRGWRELTVKREELETLFTDGSFEPKGITLFENEHALVRSEDDPKKTAICKYNAAENKLIPIKKEYNTMGITPLNMEQRFAFDLLLDDRIKLVTLVGPAGTGKTLIALACALAKTLEKKPVYEKLLVARPIIPLGRDIGYLPGSKNQKLNYWMQPIFDNLDFILKRSISSGMSNFATSELTTNNLLQSDLIEIEALTYIRGRSIPNQFLIVDEAQNLTPHEIRTIISRAGDGTKIVLTGDPEQIDNPYLDANSNGLSYTVERLKSQRIVGHVFLEKSERSELASMAVESL
ncbi:MAG: PhoH family protein [Candidatus Omnitrophica bacterium]|nr:PhoH family protein [Candidatus Omnitrophota bacterium]